MILDGARVLVHDNRLYINDIDTPSSVTFKSATVIRRYGKTTEYRGNIAYDDYGNQFGEVEYWKYPDLVDVIFDHDGRISKAHFTSGIQELLE